LGAQRGHRQRFHQASQRERLVFVEQHATAESAIKREKAIKSWSRRWKIELIEKDNPEWFDLYQRFNW
jgi:putative endonuclease